MDSRQKRLICELRFSDIIKLTNGNLYLVCNFLLVRGGYMFYDMQEKIYQEEYKELLKLVGSISGLFSSNEVAYLYYRAHENIFCKAFNAQNLSRGDISADAAKNRIGIGLKTFLYGNGSTYQKVAEFNKESRLFNSFYLPEMVEKISDLRNERIKSTMRIIDATDMYYHLVTRSHGKMLLFEEKMDLIDISNLRDILETNSSITFYDGINHYSFNKSKSTLFKRFITKDEIDTISVSVLKDPFNYLLETSEAYKSKKDTNIESESFTNNDYIILPLYSPKTNKVEKKSGLNQWNASGRIRNLNEVYIPIPAWIHKKFPTFFTYNTDDCKTGSFKVLLPNGNIYSMKVAQSGGKALMSDPNKALGEWILRDVLNLKPETIVTKEMLDIIGIDSVALTKIRHNLYALDFLKIGSYEKFESKYNLK